MIRKRIVKKQTLATGWFHWLNYPLLAVMIWSGFMIYLANDGIKSIKRIGSMYFSNQRPLDYRAAKCYDYYSGF